MLQRFFYVSGQILILIDILILIENLYTLPLFGELTYINYFCLPIRKLHKRKESQ